jgi:hypothetical protein
MFETADRVYGYIYYYQVIPGMAIAYYGGFEIYVKSQSEKPFYVQNGGTGLDGNFYVPFEPQDRT